MKNVLTVISKYQWVMIAVLIVSLAFLYMRYDAVQVSNATLAEKVNSLQSQIDKRDKSADINEQFTAQVVTDRWKRANERRENQRRIDAMLEQINTDTNVIYVDVPVGDPLQCPALDTTRAATQAQVQRARTQYLQSELWRSFCQAPSNHTYSACNEFKPATGPTR